MLTTISFGVWTFSFLVLFSVMDFSWESCSGRKQWSSPSLSREKWSWGWSGWRGNYSLGVRICSQEGVCAGGSLCGLSTKDGSSGQLYSGLVSLDSSGHHTGVVPHLRAESLLRRAHQWVCKRRGWQVGSSLAASIQSWGAARRQQHLPVNCRADSGSQGDQN